MRLTRAGFCSYGILTKGPDRSYELPIPRYDPTATNAITWVAHDLGASVLALVKHYQDRAGEVLDQTFHVANAHITYPAFAEILAKGCPELSWAVWLRADTDVVRCLAIGRPVRFTSPPTSGMKEVDDTVSALHLASASLS